MDRDYPAYSVSFREVVKSDGEQPVIAVKLRQALVRER